MQVKVESTCHITPKMVHFFSVLTYFAANFLEIQNTKVQASRNLRNVKNLGVDLYHKMEYGQK